MILLVIWSILPTCAIHPSKPPKIHLRLLVLKPEEKRCEACSSVRADHYEEVAAASAEQLVVVEWTGRTDLANP